VGSQLSAFFVYNLMFILSLDLLVKGAIVFWV